MSEQRVSSPTEIEPEGWRGRILGVTRIGGRAGFASALGGAVLTGLIVYGVATAGHHRRQQATDGPPLTKAAEQHEAWWESVANVPSSPPALPTLAPRRTVTERPRMLEREEPVLRERVPDIAQMTLVAPVHEAPPIERDPVQERRLALREAALSAPVTVRLDARTDAEEGGDTPRGMSDAATAPIVPAMLAGTEAGSGTPPESGGQDERLSFITQARQAAKPSQDRLLSARRVAISPFTLRAGSVISATLLTGINADLPGTLVAQVRADVFDSVTGRALLIPNGARLTGSYDSHVVQGQKRVLVVWHRLLYPDGSDLDLRGMPGVDPAGYAGFAASADEHIGKTIGSSALLSVISAGAQLSQPQRSAVAGAVPDVGQVIAGAVGQQIANESLQLAQRQTQAPPTLTVEPGYHFDVLVDRDIVLSVPYADGNVDP